MSLRHERSLLFLELIVGAVLGLVLFLLNYHELAALTCIIAAFHSLGRFVYTRQLSDQLDPVKKLSEIADLQHQCSLEDIKSLLNLYIQVTENDFRRVKEAVIREAITKLKRLAIEKRSDTLGTGEYYSWLNPMIDNAVRGSEIWAVSMMLDCEWDDSVPERNFVEANLRAAKRGVTVRRVFIVPKEKIPQLPTNPAIAAQMNPSSSVKAFLVEREHLQKVDVNLLKKLGDGLIAFDRRVVLIDEHSQDGTARGYVTMNPGDIANWRALWDSLLPHAEPLQAGVARYTKSAAGGAAPTPSQIKHS